MKPKHRYLLFATVLLMLCGVMVIALLAGKLLQQRQERAAWEYLPPVVRIIEPRNGDNAPAGSYLPLVSSITFLAESPVETVEWWLDGALLESHVLQAIEGVSQEYDSYDLLVPSAGPHMLLVRAINTLGVIGQSEPVTFQGTVASEAFYALTLNDDETLESIAAKYGSDAGILQSLNPGISNLPPAGTTIKVPIPPDNEPPSPPQTPPTTSSGITLVSNSPMLKDTNISSNLFPLLAVTPPKAPTNLQGEVKDCRVKLMWEDNASNENGYEVWMAAPGAPLTRLATLQAASGGVTWFEFQSPGPGYFLFWIEAVNDIGQQGSNIIYLNVDALCPTGAATHLQIEILDIAVSTSAERVYCYHSLDNLPEMRLPAQDGDFIAIQGGLSNLNSWPNTFNLPIPKDGKFKLRGECWGWSGQDLSKLGMLVSELGNEYWNGKPVLLHGEKFDLTLSVLAQNGTKMTFTERSPGIPSGTGSFNGFMEDSLPIDPSLPVPVIKRMTTFSSNEWECIFSCTELDWQWDGDQTKIIGFKIFLNGSPYPTLMAFPSQRTVRVSPPKSACSYESRWQIAAVTASSTSLLSQPYIFKATIPTTQIESCDIYVKVKFESIEFDWTKDSMGSGGPGDCDTTDAYYYIHADIRGNAVHNPWLSYQPRKFYGNGFYRPLSCGKYSFHDLADTVNPLLIYDLWRKVPPYSELLLYGELERPDEPFIVFVGAQFWDSDSGPADDLMVKFGIPYEATSFKAAVDYFGCGKTFVEEDEEDSGKSRTQYTITVYPNACESMPDMGFTK